MMYTLNWTKMKVSGAQPWLLLLFLVQTNRNQVSGKTDEMLQIKFYEKLQQTKNLKQVVHHFFLSFDYSCEFEYV